MTDQLPLMQVTTPERPQAARPTPLSLYLTEWDANMQRLIAAYDAGEELTDLEHTWVTNRLERIRRLNMQLSSAAAGLALTILHNEPRANTYALGKLNESQQVTFITDVGIVAEAVAQQFGLEAGALTTAALGIIRSAGSRTALLEQDKVREWLAGR